MKISFDSIKPVYQQIAEAIEDDILSGKLKEGEQAYSQLTIAKELSVNPATAAKGINLLVQKGVLKKQRGLSMTIVDGAIEMILKEKKDKDFLELIRQLISEAEKIKLNEADVIHFIRKSYSERGKEDE